MARLERRLRRGNLGVRLARCGLGVVVVLLADRVHRVIEQEERLPGTHQRSFGEQPFLDDAGDLRAHLGDPEGTRAPGQFAHKGDRRALERHDRHRHGTTRRASLSVMAAGRGAERHDQDAGRPDE